MLYLQEQHRKKFNKAILVDEIQFLGKIYCFSKIFVELEENKLTYFWQSNKMGYGRLSRQRGCRNSKKGKKREIKSYIDRTSR